MKKIVLLSDKKSINFCPHKFYTRIAFVSICLLSLMARADDDPCAVALQKDLYTFAESSRMQQDFVNAITKNDYEKMTHEDSFSAGIDGVGASNDWQDFTEKRKTYLDNSHFTASQSDSVKLVRMVTSDRAYASYDTCEKAHTNPNGNELLVWASKEELNKIYLHVKYINPSNPTVHVEKTRLEASITGGSVDGATKGHLWNIHDAHAGEWGINATKDYIINTQRGTDTVIVSVKKGADPAIERKFYRADAVLRIKVVGQYDNFINASPSAQQRSEYNNDNKHQPCGPNNYVGTHNNVCENKVCARLNALSGNQVYKNVRGWVTEAGAPWTDGMQAALDNGEKGAFSCVNYFGAPVDIHVAADVYERLSANECSQNTGAAIPLLNDQSTVVNFSAKCAQITNIEVTILPGGSVQNAQMSAGSFTLPGNFPLTVISVNQSGDQVLATLTYNDQKPKIRKQHVARGAG